MTITAYSKHARATQGAQVSWATVASPIGDILLVADDAGLRELNLPGSFVAREDHSADPQAKAVLDEAAAQLGAYFSGALTRFDLPARAPGDCFPAPCLAGAGRHPLCQDRELRIGRGTGREPQGGPGRRHGEQQEPARDRASLPPCDRL